MPRTRRAARVTRTTSGRSMICSTATSGARTPAPSPVTASRLFGDDLALDAASFHACVDGAWHASAVSDDLSDVIAKGFNGTPTFVVGGRRIVGAQPFEVFQAAIEAALAKG